MSPTQPAAVPTTRMTVDEYWEFVNRPGNADRFFELRRGEVIELSRPTRMHGIVCTNIGTELNIYARGIRKGYVTCNDAGVVLEEDVGTVVGPDVAYYTDANRFADVHPKWGEVPPILAVEVQSPNDKPNKVIAKVRDYLTFGVKVVWLVDYEEQTVSVFRPNSNPDVIPASGELTGGSDLPGLLLRVSDFFLTPGEYAPPPPVT
jgi:Uma2 family endonuclease